MQLAHSAVSLLYYLRTQLGTHLTTYTPKIFRYLLPQKSAQYPALARSVSTTEAINFSLTHPPDRAFFRDYSNTGQPVSRKRNGGIIAE